MAAHTQAVCPASATLICRLDAVTLFNTRLARSTVVRSPKWGPALPANWRVDDARAPCQNGAYRLWNKPISHWPQARNPPCTCTLCHRSTLQVLVMVLGLEGPGCSYAPGADVDDVQRAFTARPGGYFDFFSNW